jgi:hypothetical protein
MVHKAAEPADTPHRPLRADDLATPKVCKSRSNSASTTPCSADRDDIAELRQSLVAALAVLDRMQSARERPQSRRATAATQTDVSHLRRRAMKTKTRTRSRSDETEISFRGQSESSDDAPVDRSERRQCADLGAARTGACDVLAGFYHHVEQ